jgi:hypothetical protein
MSLLIDDDHVSVSELTAIEPELSDIAEAASITLDGDSGIIRQSWNESTDELNQNMQAFGGDIIAWPGTLTTYGAFGINRPRVRLNQITTTTPWGRRTSPLKRWLIYRALVLFYYEALNRTDKDRYEKKWNRAKDALATAWRNLWANGLPFVAIPLECPGALHAYQAGDWPAADGSSSTLVTSGSAADSQVAVAITWVSRSSGYVSQGNKNNGESGPSKWLVTDVPAGDTLAINIDGLTPPGPDVNGVIQPPRGIADGPYLTRTADGWNVYAAAYNGDQPGLMYLQNATPLPLTTTSYTLSNPLASGSYVILQGQMPDANYTFQKMLQRG